MGDADPDDQAGSTDVAWIHLVVRVGIAWDPLMLPGPQLVSRVGNPWYPRIPGILGVLGWSISDIWLFPAVPGILDSSVRSVG